MRKHTKPFTYMPKIEAVRAGELTQTIRPRNNNKPVGVGDEILFHGFKCKCGSEDWEPLDDQYMKLRCRGCGKRMGYATRLWSWRMRVEVIEVINVAAHPWGLVYPDGTKREWTELDTLARLDGILPPTGEALGKVLRSLTDLYGGKQFQVIRWRVL